MIPGPVDVADDVLAAMAQPTQPHYGNEWLEIYDETIGLLKWLFGTEADLFLMPGPGTAGLDAALGSLMAAGEKVVMAHNGFFGRRLMSVARSYGLDVCPVGAPTGRPLDPEDVRRCLADTPDARALALVHLETSTSVLNPLQALTEVAAEFGVPVIVDAVSSLGGVPLPVDAWGIDVCVTVSNKCLAAPPGLAPISISDRAWAQIEALGARAHGWYLDLRTWRRYADEWGSWHPYPTTLPTNNVMALLTSLRHIAGGGLQAYYDWHAAAAGRVREVLGAWGFTMLTEPAYTSPLITAMHTPPGVDPEALRGYLLNECRIMISGGLDDLAGKIVRVGHIGKAATDDYVEAFLEGTAAYLRSTGVDVAPPDEVA
jgi:alanine-glyoxylate transaminase/serine-glyoxylate transaminase/serine-pyruvate transaminase